MVYLGRDYSHLQTVSYKDIRGRSTTAFIETGSDGRVYLKGHGSTGLSRQDVISATDSELLQILAPNLGLPIQGYRNGRKR